MGNKSEYRYNRLDTSVVEKIRHMVEVEKLAQRVIALTLGIGESTLTRYCNRLNLKTQRTGPRDGEGHPCWKGGRYLSKGYWQVYSPHHPNKTKQGYVAEHRLVMETKLQRYLERQEVVHHLDGQTQNNHPGNLMVFRQNSEYLKAELTGKCPAWTDEGYAKLCKSGGLYANPKKLRRGESRQAHTTTHPIA